jgi:hypothetical protein
MRSGVIGIDAYLGDRVRAGKKQKEADQRNEVKFLFYNNQNLR